MALRDDDSISNSRYTLVQAIRHLRYVMERFGITKRELGVVPHGLRHQYIGEEFTARTGEAPPVKGGLRLAREADLAARRAIVEQVGHSRASIVSAYLRSNARAVQAHTDAADLAAAPTASPNPSSSVTTAAPWPPTLPV